MPVQMHKWIRWKSKQKKGQTIISLVDRNEVHRFWNGFQVERAVQRRKCTKVHLFGNYKSLKLRSTYRLLTRINWIIWIRGIVNFTNRLYLHRLLTFQRQTEKKGKKKTQPNENHLKQRKYCKTDSIAHVVWPDAVWWHVSNVAAHTHIIPFAISVLLVFSLLDSDWLFFTWAFRASNGSYRLFSIRNSIQLHAKRWPLSMCPHGELE